MFPTPYVGIERLWHCCYPWSFLFSILGKKWHVWRKCSVSMCNRILASVKLSLSTNQSYEMIYRNNWNFFFKWHSTDSLLNDCVSVITYGFLIFFVFYYDRPSTLMLMVMGQFQQNLLRYVENIFAVADNEFQLGIVLFSVFVILLRTSLLLQQ